MGEQSANLKGAERSRANQPEGGKSKPRCKNLNIGNETPGKGENNMTTDHDDQAGSEGPKSERDQGKDQ